ncbi:MAG: histidinol-phosphate transaminase [Gammaproteobacteria bacterium]|nr:histidinol-phosphate transaminase [Gammaproteobacteria bacterium]MDE0366110.1 histidinol-phosphate transaminase [Gammaproteobacteria bacterium]
MIQTRTDLSHLPVYEPGAADVPHRDNAIKLSSNESALGPSPSARAVYEEQVATLLRYPDPGCSGLRSAIAEFNNLSIDQVLIGTGSESLIRLLTRLYAGEGDEVVISEHAFTLYKVAAASVGARPVLVPENDCVADLDGMIDAITERTKIVYLANPNNPTGTMRGAGAIRRFADRVPDSTLVVLDSAYCEYVDPSELGNPLSLVREGRTNIVVTRTFSKAYGLAGLRIGWLYGARPITDSLRKVGDVFGVSTPAQATAIAALSDQDHVRRELAHVERWRPWLTAELENLKLRVTPSVCNFVLAHCDPVTISAADCFQRLLDRGVIVRPVANYGLPEGLRITIGAEPDLRAFIGALQDVLATD